MLRGAAAIAVFFLCSGCLPGIPDVPAGDDSQGTAAGASGCGSGTWKAGWLEIHHIDAGEAVSTLVVSPAGRTVLVDVGEAEWNCDEGAKTVGSYVRQVMGCAHLDYVVLSHFHVDHAGLPGHGGLWHLVVQQGFSVGKLVHRDLYRYRGSSASTVSTWREYLQSAAAGLAPEVAVLGKTQVELGRGVDFAFVAVDGNGTLPAGDFSSDPAPPDENDYSIAALLRFGRFDYFTAGDLSGRTLVSGLGYSYHDGETALAARVKDVDVYRVSHHGSSNASNETLLAEIAPEVAIVQVGDGNENGHPSQSTLSRLAATSTVYLTQHGNAPAGLRDGRVVGHVVVRTANGIDYTVADDAFTASDPPRTDSDGDGYFAEADPDDSAAEVVPAANGGCDTRYQPCGM